MSAIKYETVTLDRVTLNSTRLLDQTLLDGMTKDVRVCEWADAYEMRRSFRGWGKVERKTLTCPASWWDHLKLALRSRWPRLLRRLHVRMESATVENGAIVTGLSNKLKGRHIIIPISLPSTRMGYVADESDDDPGDE